MSDLKYLRGYPEPLLAQVRQLIAEQRLGDYLARRYPDRHQVQSDKALYGYVQQLKQDHLKSAPPIDKVLYDNRLDLTHRALGLHTAVSRGQGGKLMLPGFGQIEFDLRLFLHWRELPGS